MFFFFWNVGALTSKMYAFQSRSWELDVSYIVSLVEGLAEQVKLELKGLELMWSLPYNSLKGVENWLSDWIRFSIDGFYLNRVSKFYVKKSLIFAPLINLLMCKNIKLYKKYFEYFWIKNLFKTYNMFKNLKQFFFQNYFFLYVVLNLFSSLFHSYSNTRKSISFFKNFKNSKFNRFFFKKNNSETLFQFLKVEKRVLVNSFLWKFFNKFKKKYNLTNLYFLNFKYEKFQSIVSERLYLNIFLPLLNKNFFKTINFFFNMTSDVNFFSFMSYYIYKLKFNNNLVFNSTSITIKKNRIENFLSYFNFFSKRDIFWEPNLIFLIGVNLWLYAPKVHLYLWKLSKNLNIKFVSFFCNDFFLFFHFNFGHNKKILNNFVNGQHWVNSFLKNSFKIVYIFGGFIFNNLYFLKIVQLLKNTNYFYKKMFFYKNNFLNDLNLKNTFTKKNYFYTFYINCLILFNSPINYMYNFFIDNKKISNKENLFLFNKNKSKNNLNIFFDYKNFFDMKKFNKTKFDIKNSYNILLETNLNESYINKNIDFIFPLTLYIENFSFFTDFIGNLQKSLFIKFGPWLAWNCFNFSIFIFSSLFYPFFWVFLFSKHLYMCLYLNIVVWVQGMFTKKIDKNIFFKFKKICLLKKTIENYKNSFFINYFNYDKYFSYLSFFVSSRYISLALWNKYEVSFNLSKM